VQEEADPQVRAFLAEHRRDELELVILHPDDGAVLGDAGGRVGEAPVDLDVVVPPVTVELRRGDRVVVERPERAVGQPLVVLLDVGFGQGDGMHADAVGGERRMRLTHGS
jgi:hypothetical protein